LTGLSFTNSSPRWKIPEVTPFLLAYDCDLINLEGTPQKARAACAPLLFHPITPRLALITFYRIAFITWSKSRAGLNNRQYAPEYKSARADKPVGGNYWVK
jgi:hypothetical protein